MKPSPDAGEKADHMCGATGSQAAGVVPDRGAAVQRDKEGGPALKYFRLNLFKGKASCFAPPRSTLPTGPGHAAPTAKPAPGPTTPAPCASGRVRLPAR